MPSDRFFADQVAPRGYALCAVASRWGHALCAVASREGTVGHRCPTGLPAGAGYSGMQVFTSKEGAHIIWNWLYIQKRSEAQNCMPTSVLLGRDN